jgi:hypothetical protein
MKTFIFPRLSFVLVLTAGLSAAMADTIKLKNGSVLEGTITEETADSVTIEVEEKGIKDWPKVKRSDIAEMKKATPDEKEAADLIAKLKPTPDMMPAAEYEKRIKTQIQPWLDKNKASKKKPEVEELLKLYNEELTKVKAGDFKLRSQWITAEEAKWNEYNINARKLRSKFEELVKAKKPVEAYSVFANMEVTGAASVDFPPVLEAVKKALPNMEAAIARAIEEYPALAEDRKKLLGQQTGEKKKEMDAVIKAEVNEFRLKSAAEKKLKIPVPSFYPYDLKSIQTSMEALKKEAARLNAIDIPGLTFANKRFEQGLKDMHNKSFLSAKNNFEAAAKFHTKDATVKKMVDDAGKAVEAAKKKPGVK